MHVMPVLCKTRRCILVCGFVNNFEFFQPVVVFNKCSPQIVDILDDYNRPELFAQPFAQRRLTSANCASDMYYCRPYLYNIAIYNN